MRGWITVVLLVEAIDGHSVVGFRKKNNKYFLSASKRSSRLLELKSCCCCSWGTVLEIGLETLDIGNISTLQKLVVQNRLVFKD